MSEEYKICFRFWDFRYNRDLVAAEIFEEENDIAPQHPQLLAEKWYEFKEELLKKVRRVE